MLEKHPVETRHIMSTKIIQLGEEDTAAFAMQIFERCKISGAPVVDAYGQYTGVLSKTDLICSRMVYFAEKNRGLDSILVKQLMTIAPLITVEESQPVERTAQLMLENNIHRVFVRNKQGKIVGIVSCFDVLKFVRSNAADYSAPSSAERKKIAASLPPATRTDPDKDPKNTRLWT